MPIFYACLMHLGVKKPDVQLEKNCLQVTAIMTRTGGTSIKAKLSPSDCDNDDNWNNTTVRTPEILISVELWYYYYYYYYY